MWWESLPSSIRLNRNGNNNNIHNLCTLNDWTATAMAMAMATGSRDWVRRLWCANKWGANMHKTCVLHSKCICSNWTEHQSKSMKQNWNGIHLAEDWLDASKPTTTRNISSRNLYAYMNILIMTDPCSSNASAQMLSMLVGLKLWLGFYSFNLCCVGFVVIDFVFAFGKYCENRCWSFYRTSDETIELKTLCCSPLLFSSILFTSLSLQFFSFCCCFSKCESALKLSFVWTWIMNPHKSSRFTHKHIFNWIFALTFSLYFHFHSSSSSSSSSSFRLVCCCCCYCGRCL